MVTLRASQINGCSVCVDIHTRELEQIGESNERIHLVAAWREAPYFSDAERAALALTEAATRLADRPDPVPDDVWDEAARHYTEPQLAALVVAIAAINAFNRVNAATRQITGDYVARIVEASPPEPPPEHQSTARRASRRLVWWPSPRSSLRSICCQLNGTRTRTSPKMNEFWATYHRAARPAERC